MIDIAQSPFLQALGLAIANSLWQAALLWLLCFLYNNIAKTKANQKYLLTTAAALLSLLWFVFSTCYYYWQLSAVAIADSQNLQADNIVSSGTAYNIWHSYSQALMPYLSCAYMLVTALLAIRLFNGFKEVKTLRTTQLKKAPVAWRLFVKKYAAVLQIEKQVEVWLSANVNSPLTIGFWKPIILLPLAGINHLSTQQVEAILLHELAHIRRFDYLVNILLQVAEILLFFNPFVRLLLKQAYQERENSCDDWVLQFNYNGTDYARALLSIEQTSQAHLLALGVNNHHKYFLLNRIKRIVSPEKKSTDYRTQLSTLAFVMFTMLLMNGFVPAITDRQHAPKAMLMSNADFFAPTAQMKTSAIDEIEAAAKAFSIARNAGLKKMQPAYSKKTEDNAAYNKDGIINMVTEEEEMALASNPVTSAFERNNEALVNPAVFEINKLATEVRLKAQPASETVMLLDYVQAWQDRMTSAQNNIQHDINIIEREGKVKPGATQDIQKKLRVYEQELQSLLSSVPKDVIQNTTDEKLKAEIQQQEKLITSAAERYAAAMAELHDQQYSYSYNIATSPASERRFATGTSVPSANATSHKTAPKIFAVTNRAIVRSKDNKHITLTLASFDKEISICMPADTREAALETMKQLEASGVLVIEHKTLKSTKPTLIKKPRVIVSL